MVAAGDEGTDETGRFGQAAAIMDFFMILPLVGRVWDVETEERDIDEVADEGFWCEWDRKEDVGKAQRDEDGATVTLGVW